MNDDAVHPHGATVASFHHAVAYVSLRKNVA